MSLAGLFNDELQILPFAAGAEDEYGNAAETWTSGDTVKGRLEQRSGVEVTRDRQTYISDWVFFTWPTVVLSVQDRMADAFGRTFEILSLAQQSDRTRNHHLVVSLRHVDGG